MMKLCKLYVVHKWSVLNTVLKYTLNCRDYKGTHNASLTASYPYWPADPALCSVTAGDFSFQYNYPKHDPRQNCSLNIRAGKTAIAPVL